jgi:hypothetical protein
MIDILALKALVREVIKEELKEMRGKTDCLEHGPADQRLKTYFDSANRDEAEHLVKESIAIREVAIAESARAFDERPDHLKPKARGVKGSPTQEGG